MVGAPTGRSRFLILCRIWGLRFCTKIARSALLRTRSAFSMLSMTTATAATAAAAATMTLAIPPIRCCWQRRLNFSQTASAIPAVFVPANLAAAHRVTALPSPLAYSHHFSRGFARFFSSWRSSSSSSSSSSHSSSRMSERRRRDRDPVRGGDETDSSASEHKQFMGRGRGRGRGLGIRRDARRFAEGTDFRRDRDRAGGSMPSDRDDESGGYERPQFSGRGRSGFRGVGRGRGRGRGGDFGRRGGGRHSSRDAEVAFARPTETGSDFDFALELEDAERSDSAHAPEREHDGVMKIAADESINYDEEWRALNMATAKETETEMHKRPKTRKHDEAVDEGEYDSGIVSDVPPLTPNAAATSIAGAVPSRSSFSLSPTAPGTPRDPSLAEQRALLWSSSPTVSIPPLKSWTPFPTLLRQSAPSFADLNLSSPICHRLEEQGFKTPSIIQCAAIPHLLRAPSYADSFPDVVVEDVTGQGKTLAYLLPILAQLDRYMNGLQAVIVAPTKELAQQIYRVAVDVVRPTLKKNPESHAMLRIEIAVGAVNPTLLHRITNPAPLLPQLLDERGVEKLRSKRKDRQLKGHPNDIEYIAKVEQRKRKAHQAQLDRAQTKQREAGDDGEYTPGMHTAPWNEFSDCAGKAHLLIGTPVALHDLLVSRQIFDVRTLKYIVFDEIDGLLNSPQHRDIFLALLKLRRMTFPSAALVAERANADLLTKFVLPVTGDAAVDAQLPATQWRKHEYHPPQYGRAMVTLVSATFTEMARTVAERFLNVRTLYITAASVAEEAARRRRSLTTRMPQEVCHWFVELQPGQSRQLMLQRLADHIRADFQEFRKGVPEQLAQLQKGGVAFRDPNILKGGTNAVGPGLLFAHAMLVFIGRNRRLGAAPRGGNDDHQLIAKNATALAEHGHTVGILTERSSRFEKRAALRPGQCDVVLASDAYSRGMDLKTLTHIINYTLPSSSSGYTHRAGRVGRLSALYSQFGHVITLVNGAVETEMNAFRQMMEKLHLRPQKLYVKADKVYRKSPKTGEMEAVYFGPPRSRALKTSEIALLKRQRVRNDRDPFELPSLRIEVGHNHPQQIEY